MLTYRPVVPGSDHHLALMRRAGAQPRSTGPRGLGTVLYPDLTHRRACEAMRAAGTKVDHKREAPRADTREASEPTDTPADTGGPGGRSIKSE